MWLSISPQVTVGIIFLLIVSNFILALFAHQQSSENDKVRNKLGADTYNYLVRGE